MGTMTVVAVEDEGALAMALATAQAVIETIDATCSRFRLGSPLSLLNRRAGWGPQRVPRVLEEAIDVAIWAADVTGGLVDPTVGAQMERMGYTTTFSALAPDGPALDLEACPVAGWSVVERRRGWVCLPTGVRLDLGAVGKAWAADRAAQAAAERTGVGVMVECGGDLAMAGPAPPDGWRVRVTEGAADRRWQDVRLFDGGLATSGTGARSWRRGGRLLHHIVDPRTGLPAATCWRTASVAAADTASANAAATAAVVLGDAAPSWLADRQLPARLVSLEGDVVNIGDWPAGG